VSDLVAYLKRQEEWSSRTFGHGTRTGAVTAHIAKELDEIRAKPHDLEEWIDVIILALDGYWRAGGDPREIMGHLQAKQDKNFTREWSMPKSQDDPVEHVREEFALPSLGSASLPTESPQVEQTSTIQSGPGPAIWPGGFA
jgi:hypothetical protein